MAATERLFGSSIKRREDPRLLTGKGVYVDDVKLPGTTYASFVRSPHAHARIRGIDSSAARKLPGVVAVYTGKDLAAAGVKSLPVGWLLPNIKLPPHLPLAVANPATGDVTLWVTTQNPHVHRLLMSAFILGMPEHKLRVISPDVGGGFGSKIFVYPEECVVTWASKALSRPVKWTAERRESFMTDAHGRDHQTDAEMALDADGRILALRVNSTVNLGAYISLFAPSVPTYLYGTLLAGAYTTPAIHVEVTAAFTNTTPVDAYRGAGRPEACYVVERMVDLAARELGVDPVELRRRNFIEPDKFPYQTPVAVTYDSGNYEAALDKALGMLDYTAFRKEQDRLRKAGRYLGVGFSTYVEACGPGPSQVAGARGGPARPCESAEVGRDPTEEATILTGSHSHGQGHETTFAQIAADELGLPMDDIEIVHGDTGQVPFGMG